jgi:uncharacterized protein (DUF1499 family)
MWLRRLARALALCALALALLSGPGARLGLWHWRFGFSLFGAAIVLGLGAAVAGAAGLAIPRLRSRFGRSFMLSLLLGAAVAAVPLSFLLKVRGIPSIHDITTDAENPPRFVAVLPLRAGAANPPEYPGAHIFELQGIAYPEVQPLMLSAAPAQAFSRALAAARELGWEVVAAQEQEGRIEAVDSTFWFGFKDDVVIRVAPSGGGSRIDIRSKSRVGRSDVGANAKRIQEFLTAMKNA